MASTTYLQAIVEAEREEMRRDKRVFVMGNDVRLSFFGTTTGLLSEFGPERVRDTPISENAVIGAAAGAALVGQRPIVELSIACFTYVAMDQLVSITAKATYMYGGQARLPVVVRCAMFYGASNAAQHSDRPYPMFMNVPGLKIIVPSGPYEAKGLLKSAIRDENPVLCFEDASLWSRRETLPDEEYLVPLGKGVVKREGSDVTVVAIGASLGHALAAAAALEPEGIGVEVIDPRSLVPLDKDAILASVEKTGRLVVVDPAHKTCSAASEISATVAEEGYAGLRAPIIRVATPDVQIPFSPALEGQLYPSKEKVVAAVRRVLNERSRVA